MVYLFLANGFEEVEALCPLDLLRRAGIEVTTVGVGGGELIAGTHGIAVQPDIPDTMYRDPHPEMVILPGGMPGAKHLDASATVAQAVRAASNSGGYLAAICAAPMVLGHLGYTKGKQAVCFPGFERELTGATVCDLRVVRDGTLVTAVGMGAAMEFGLELVACLRGEQAAEALRHSVLAV